MLLAILSPAMSEHTRHLPPRPEAIIGKTLAAPQIQLDEMKVEWKCVFWISSAPNQQYGLQSCSHHCNYKNETLTVC